MKRTAALSILVAVVLLAYAVTAETQQVTGKALRVGYLNLASALTQAARAETFRQSLLAHGYVGGKNLVIEWRYGEFDANRLPFLAADLVRLKVDVIVTGGSAATRAARNATGTIPIVMTQDNDPIADGFVKSLAQPGGNITGVSILATELSGKRFEILKEVIPSLSRVAVISNPKQNVKEVGAAAEAVSVELQYLNVLTSKDIEPTFHAAAQGLADAGLAMNLAVLSSQRENVAALAVKYRLPVMYSSDGFPNAGGLMSYAPNLRWYDHRAAFYVDRILKGANPANLPVEQPMRVEFLVNVKAAKQIGLTIPPNVLVRADKVIR